MKLSHAIGLKATPALKYWEFRLFWKIRYSRALVDDVLGQFQKRKAVFSFFIMVAVEVLLTGTVAMAIWFAMTSKPARKSQLPGPWFELPFFGHLPLVGFLGLRMTVLEAYGWLAKRYGNVFRLQMGIIDGVVLNDYESVTSILNSEDWTDRFNSSYVNDLRSFGKSLGVLFASGSEHKEIRRFTTRSLRNHGFGNKMSMEAGILEEMEDLLLYIKQEIDAKGPRLCFKLLFNVSVLSIAWRLMTGQRLSRHDPDLIKLLELLEKYSLNNSIAFNLGAALPKLAFLAPGRKISLEFEENVKEFSRKLMKERQEKGTFKEEQNDFVDDFLHKIELSKDASDDKNASYYNEEQLIVVLDDFIMTASETSSSAAEFAVLCVLLNPQVQRKIQEEIDQVVGRDRLPAVSDLERMPYTHATMLETLRLSNIIPVNLRTAVRDTHVDKYFVPKGAVALINQYAVHMNPEKWHEPTAFRPERFLSPDGKNVTNANRIIPFGSGKRVCPGEAVARATIFAILTALLQTYSIEEDGSDLKSIWLKFHEGFSRSTMSFTARLVPRYY